MADDTAMHVHVLRVRDHRIRCADPVMVAGGVGHDAVALDLDADWAGLSCVVTLGEGDGAWTAAVGADPVEVPASAIAEPGWLPVSVTGYGDDGAVRATTEACAHLLRVAESGYVPSASDVPDAPDLLGQLLAAGQRATDAADAADDAAKAAQDAVARVDEALSDIGDAADNAAAARKSAEAAAKSASDAKASESSARASAESASADAGAASSSATAARQSATKAASSATGAGKRATEAKASADAASQSASSASDDARTASQSASTAASAASSANDAAADAQSAADAAQTAATSAQEDASTAQTAAETATTQAQAASASATAAAQSAADAKASADLAAGWVPADGEPGQILTKTEDGTAWRDAPSGNVLTGTATGYVDHAEDAYAQKPIEVRVKGRTVKNLWPSINRSSDGITVSTDGSGLITVSGTSTASIKSIITVMVPAQAGRTCSVVTSSANSGMSSLNYEIAIDASRSVLRNDFISTMFSPNIGGSGKTFTTPADTAGLACIVRVDAGLTVNASFRVMLVDGTEAPDCFTPPASITSVQPEKLVTAGKNLLPVVSQRSDTVSGVTITSNGDGSYTLNGTATADIYHYMPTDTGFRIPPGTYTVSGGSTDKIEVTIVKDNQLLVGTDSVPSVTTTTPGDCYFYLRVKNGTTLNNVTVYPQLELGSTATPYEPPAVTTTTLPEVELRSLPNGTCDELVIKADGSCEVDRKLGKNTIDAEHPITIKNVYPASGDDLPYTIVNDLFPSFASYEDGVEQSVQKYVHSSTWPFVENVKSRGMYRTWNAIVFVDERFTDTETAQSIINETGGTFIAQVPATTEPQSPVTLPALPAPTFNQYHDSPVPSDTSTEYERDINIAFDQLAKQIAGTVSAVAVREASTIEEE